MMATRKPDWAQRMVEQQQDYGRVIAKSDAAALLRAHHRKVKRMVQKLNQDSAHLYCNCDEINAYRLACEHIMVKLEELER